MKMSTFSRVGRFSKARTLGVRRLSSQGGPSLQETNQLKRELAELTAELEGKKKRSGLISALGFTGALILVGSFIDETSNVVVGMHSSTWDAVEGEIVSEPVSCLVLLLN